jgi:nicotinamidase-related amidase
VVSNEQFHVERPDAFTAGSGRGDPRSHNNGVARIRHRRSHLLASTELHGENGAGAIASLLARARKAGVTIAYGTRPPTMSKWLPDVLPAPGDIKIESQAQDRFYKTGLDEALKAKGITTLILTGWKVSGSVTYTSVGATLRGYTVVVPVDASLDATDYEIAVGLFQILHQHSSNPANEPLKNAASTLSRTDLITFK